MSGIEIFYVTKEKELKNTNTKYGKSEGFNILPLV